MSLYRDEGVVLRAQKLGEADRIVTLLTREHGRVRAVAKGVRRTSSRIGARLEPFGHVDIQFYEGRSLDGVTQVETIASFGATLVHDYARYTAGQAMLETAERLTPEEREPSVQQYLLLVGGLRALVSGEHDSGPGARRLPRALALGRRLGAELRRLRPLRRARPAPGVPRAAGGALCADDRIPGLGRTGAGDLRAARRRCSRGDWATADASELRARREASGLVAAYLSWQLERGLRSLPLVERSPEAPARPARPLMESRVRLGPDAWVSGWACGRCAR